MAQKNDNPADPFKKALAEATKTMSGDTDLNVTYSVDPSGLSGDTMRLPQVSRRMSKDEVLLTRGTADALALHRRLRRSDRSQWARQLGDSQEKSRWHRRRLTSRT